MSSLLARKKGTGLRAKPVFALVAATLCVAAGCANKSGAGTTEAVSAPPGQTKVPNNVPPEAAAQIQQQQQQAAKDAAAAAEAGKAFANSPYANK